MYKKIRKSVAEVISNVEDPEQFEWNKWLKEPQIYLERFPKPRIETKKIENFKEFSEPALYQVKKFTLTKFRVSEEIKNIIVKKKKTFQIFFSFPKPYQNKISIFESNASKLVFLSSFFYKGNDLFFRVEKDKKESITSLIPKIISKKPEPIQVKVKTHSTDLYKVDNFKCDCLIDKPKNSELKIDMPATLPADKIFNLNVLRYNTNKKYLAIVFNKLEKIPSLKNIPVIALEEIKEQLQKSDSKKILAVAINKLNQKPKQYRLKFIQLEKMRVPSYHLKNLQTKETKLRPFNFSLLEKPKVNEKNLVVEYLPELKIINPGIIEPLLPVEDEKAKRKIQKVKIKKETLTTEPKKVELLTKKINLEKVEPNIKNLLAYQKEGIRFLLTNKTALLSDEIGIDKKAQAIYALQSALKQGVIKNVLIACPNSHIGRKNVAEHVNNSEGWESQIHKIAPELSIATINDVDDEQSIAACMNAEIFITSYKTLIEISSDSTKEPFTKNVECLILDEAQYLINNVIQSEQSFNFPSSKYRWILSSLPSQLNEEKLIPKLKNHLVGFDALDGKLNRTKHILSNELPALIRNDYWHDLDSEQIQEFENTMLQGRKRILDLIKGGNPFIIQSNIFTLIHQIKQLGNFSVHKETSPKSELLLDQLDSIIASGQKCIIFSQYDKQGIQKIERLLKNNQIRYVLYQSGMPLKELENSASAFRKESRISVMLAGLTAASVKVKIPDASYLIHFDQWWNPITQWQYEEKSLNVYDFNQSMESVNVFNYFSNNSVEINIRETLQKKGLLIKNLIEFLSNETLYSLISNEDWLDILGIEHQKSRKNLKPDTQAIMDNLSGVSLDEIGQKTKSLFSKFGYKNFISKPDMLHEELSIYGIATKGLNEIKSAILCLPFKTKDTEPVETFVKEASKNNSRIFVICSDEIIKQVANDPHERVTYIGQELFASYLSQFQIN
jgi:SNF2 family DNA or RNA helicase